MKRTVVYVFLIIISISITGCSKFFAPTYPKEEISVGIQELCRKEYSITEKIDVKIVGKTLGVRIHLDGLLDINLKLQEEALDKIQKLFRIMRRVCLSTDADLDFYIIIGFDKTLGVEVVFYSYVTDLQKAIAGWMSPEDYFQRLIKTMRLDTLRWGNTRIKKLLKDLESGSIIKVIVDNFAAGTKLSSLNPEFLKILTELSKKDHIRIELIKEYSIPVGTEKRLYYLEAKEYFTPKLENTAELSYPSGTIHKLYILITMEELNPAIEAIFSEEDLPEKYRSLGLPDIWIEDDFFVEDLAFHKFLSSQIVQRIQAELSKDKEEKEEIIPFSMEGNFIIKEAIDMEVRLKDPSENILNLTFRPKNDKVKDFVVTEEIFELTTKTIRDVCNKYKFYDLGKIQFQDHKGNSLLVLDKPNLFK